MIPSSKQAVICCWWTYSAPGFGEVVHVCGMCVWEGVARRRSLRTRICSRVQAEAKSTAGGAVGDELLCCGIRVDVVEVVV